MQKFAYPLGPSMRLSPKRIHFIQNQSKFDEMFLPLPSLLVMFLQRATLGPHDDRDLTIASERRAPERRDSFWEHGCDAGASSET
jgi:hypothetical protein